MSFFAINLRSVAIENKIKIPNTHVFNQAIKNGDIEVVKNYLKAGFNPNKTYFGNAIICTAIQKKQNDMLDFLLKNGATPNNFKSQIPPLYYAVIKNNPYAVDSLLKAGADINQTFMGNTAEEIAYTTNNTELLKIFAKYRETKNKANKNVPKNNQFCGIGIKFYKDLNKVFIIQILENSPASKANIPLGAEILQINHKKVKGLSVEQISKLIKEEDEKLLYLYLRTNYINKLYVLEKEPIALPKVVHQPRFDLHWQQIAPESYLNAIYIETMPQYSPHFKMILNANNYWANRKYLFQKGYNACMSYPPHEQNNCLMNLVNRETRKTEDDKHFEIQEKMYYQKEYQNTLLQLINNSIKGY